MKKKEAKAAKLKKGGKTHQFKKNWRKNPLEINKIPENVRIEKMSARSVKI